MKFQYENINHNKNLPLKIFIHNIRKSPHHWHGDIELLFILKGDIKVECSGGQYSLNEGDIFLVNGNTVHATESFADNLTLVLQINRELFEPFYPGFRKIYFNVNSCAGGNEQNTSYNDLRRSLAQLMNIINKQEDGYLLHAVSCLHMLCYRLVKYYAAGLLAETNSIDPNDKKLNDVVEMVNRDYNKDISLACIAGQLHLSEGYLSRYFSSHMDIPLAKYINDIRLKKSIDLLLNSEMNITNIAYECGFSQPKSYFVFFKNAYRITPAEYRKRLRNSPNTSVTEFNYLQINMESAFGYLYKYLEPDGNAAEDTFVTVAANIEIDPQKSLGEFKNSACKIGCFGRAAEGLRADWREQFRVIQQEIGFENVRCHGIFNDEMMVCYRNRNGAVSYNFTYVDDLFDFLLSCGARPFLELGLMPGMLASGEQSVFWWKGNVTPPKHIADWTGLVEAFFKHLILRYGAEEVSRWYVEIWNEPDVSSFWTGSREEFFEFFHATYKTVKSVNPAIRIGGFELASGEIGDMLEWMSEKFRKAGLQLDFFTYHAYPYCYVQGAPPAQMPKDLNTFYQNVLENNYRRADADYFDDYAKRVKERITAAFPDVREIFVTEWNASIYSRDLILDTCFMAPFVIKNLFYLNRHTDGVGFWTFTDIFEEMQPTGAPFQGGFGMMTRNGIQKPQYHAYAFFKKLSGGLLYEGDHLISTAAKDGIVRLLAFHYVHPDRLYKFLDTSGITSHERYACFESDHTTRIRCRIVHLNGRYRLDEYSLSREEGSAFDEWIKMGAPEMLTQSVAAYLNAVSRPKYKTSELTVDGAYEIVADLMPHETVLYELIPI